MNENDENAGPRPGEDREEWLRKTVTDFLLHAYTDQLAAIVYDRDEGRHFSLPIHLTDLGAREPAAAELVILHPAPALRVLHQAASEAQRLLLQSLAPRDADADRGPGPARRITPAHLRRLEEAANGVPPTMKGMVHVRPYGLPCTLSSDLESSPSVNDLRSRHVGRLVTLAGTVVKCMAVQALEAEKGFECTKCKNRLVVYADLTAGGRLVLPPKCTSVTKRGEPCNNGGFRPIPDSSFHSDIQEVKLQEKKEVQGVGPATRSLTLVLRDDLADSCLPGDEVEATGVVTRRWKQSNPLPGQPCDVEHILLVAHLLKAGPQGAATVGQQAQVDPGSAERFAAHWAAAEASGRVLASRDELLYEVCPQLHGLTHCKLAAALSLAGGEAVITPDGRRLRGEIHVLMVGDPGTGKSQVLRSAARLARRSVITTGKGTSGVGLTAAATREAGGWTLEAGALVLADGGVACIDEFSRVAGPDRAALHEAMEQGTVSVAKAGLVVSLPTRTAVMAASNPPKGGIVMGETLEKNTGIPSPLLSRFDILIGLRDRRDPALDALLADRVLGARMARSGRGAARPRPTAAAAGGPGGGDPTQTQLGDQELAPGGAIRWNTAELRKYFAWLKCRPVPLTREAEAVLGAYFRARRIASGASTDPSRSTVRLLEGTCRLAQAHARLVGRPKTTQQDAIMAVALSELAPGPLQEPILFGLSLAEAFPGRDADAAYGHVETRVIGSLTSAGGFGVETAILALEGGRGAGLPLLEPDRVSGGDGYASAAPRPATSALQQPPQQRTAPAPTQAPFEEPEELDLSDEEGEFAGCPSAPPSDDEGNEAGPGGGVIGGGGYDDGFALGSA